MLLTFFWDQEIETIATRYYSSKFLCYSNAKALKQSFDKALEELEKKLILVQWNKKTCKIALQYPGFTQSQATQDNSS